MSGQNEPLHLETEMLSPGGVPSAAGHSWKQQGPYLVCQTCPREHALSVTVFGAGPTDIFIGLDKVGKPRFKRIGDGSW